MPTRTDNAIFGTKNNEDPLKLVDGVYQDFDFPTSQLKGIGVLEKPDFDTTNLGYLMPKNDATEIVGGSRQLPHEWQKSTVIYPHVHIIQSEDVQYVFKIQYRVYEIGAAVPAFSATVTSTGYAQTYVSGDLHQIVNFPSIDLAAITGNSAWVDVKVWREDNVGAGDVLMKGFDFHIKINRLGSVGEYLY